jgi:hypothetical protein
MERRLLFAGMLLLFIASFTACKKEEGEERPLKAKIVGKWQVNKVEVTTYPVGSLKQRLPLIIPHQIISILRTIHQTMLKCRYQAIVILGVTESQLETPYFLIFSSKDLDGQISVITANQLQFKASVVGSDPKVIETYYLSR